MSRHLWGAFAAVSLLAWVGPAQATNLAVVDFQAAADRTTEGKKATSKLESFYTTRQAELDKLKVELEKEVADYQARAMVMSPEARAEAEQKLGMKQAQLQQMAMQSEAEFGQMQMQLTQELGEKMRTVAGVIAKEKGFDLVLDKAVAAFVSSKVPDITEDLVTKYNATHP